MHTRPGQLEKKTRPETRRSASTKLNMFFRAGFFPPFHPRVLCVLRLGSQETPHGGNLNGTPGVFTCSVSFSTGARCPANPFASGPPVWPSRPDTQEHHDRGHSQYRCQVQLATTVNCWFSVQYVLAKSRREDRPFARTRGVYCSALRS